MLCLKSQSSPYKRPGQQTKSRAQELDPDGEQADIRPGVVFGAVLILRDGQHMSDPLAGASSAGEHSPPCPGSPAGLSDAAHPPSPAGTRCPEPGDSRL